METDEVCGRPLHPFAAHTHVYWLLLEQGGIAPAGATRRQWKQTKSAVAPLTPSGRH